MRRRVVVTGAGCVSPLGSDISEVMRNLTAGKSGAGPITIFDASHFPVRIAAEVKDWDISEVGEDPEFWSSYPRQTRFAVGAAIKAAQSAGINDVTLDPLRLGVYLGCGETFPDFEIFAGDLAASINDDGFDATSFLQRLRQSCGENVDAKFEPSVPAIEIARLFDAQGPNVNTVTACVSSSRAIGEAVEMIRRDDADMMFCGGSHSMIHPFGITGFHRLSTLSTLNDSPERAARPFDRERDGFVVGEGAAIFLVEELDHARRRGAEIWGEITGFGASHDSYRVTDPHPEGRGAETCMRGALNDARLNPEDIQYINAHGTGTVANDKIETAAIKSVFGDDAYRVPISSTKSMTGHFTTAGGAFELLVCLMAIRENVIPPTINYENADPECDLDYVPNTAREISCQHVLSNSFGFGGLNVALVVSGV